MVKKITPVCNYRLILRIFGELNYKGGDEIYNFISDWINKLAHDIVVKAHEMSETKHKQMISYELMGSAINFYAKSGHKKIYGVKSNTIKYSPCVRLIKEISNGNSVEVKSAKLLQEYLTEQIYDIVEELYTTTKELKPKKFTIAHFDLIKEKLPL